MLRHDSGNIYYTPFGEQEVLLGKLSDGEMSEGYFTLGNVSLPVERFTELKSEWDKIYPNGRPVLIPTIETNAELTNHQLVDIIKFALENNSEFKSLILPPTPNPTV